MGLCKELLSVLICRQRNIGGDAEWFDGTASASGADHKPTEQYAAGYLLITLRLQNCCQNYQLNHQSALFKSLLVQEG